MLRITSFVSLFVLFLFLCGCDAGVFVESRGKYIAMGAVDDGSCGVLLSAEWPDASAQILAQYRAAIDDGHIVHLESGTRVKDLEGVYFENGKPIPSDSFSTEREMKARKISFAQWVIPKEGRFKGKRLCVSMAVIRGSYPPL
jgi:hypothetical protein